MLNYQLGWHVRWKSMTSKQCKSEKFLHLPVGAREKILETAAVKLGQPAKALEKDVWLCWSLQTLFSMPDAHPMAFKGGTSECCTTIRRHSTTSSLVLVKSKVQSTLGRLSTSHREYLPQRGSTGVNVGMGRKEPSTLESVGSTDSRALDTKSRFQRTGFFV